MLTSLPSIDSLDVALVGRVRQLGGIHDLPALQAQLHRDVRTGDLVGRWGDNLKLRVGGRPV
jgi:hypothetical protein